MDYKVYKDFCKPGYIDHLRRLGMYRFCMPVDDDKDQIVARVLPIGRHSNPAQVVTDQLVATPGLQSISWQRVFLVVSSVLMISRT